MARLAVQRSIRLTPESDQKLRRIAQYLGISVNALIQKLVDKLDDSEVETANDRDVDRFLRARKIP